MRPILTLFLLACACFAFAQPTEEDPIIGGSDSGGGGGASEGGPLPIELLYFDARLEEGVVLLSWATATEIDNDHFTIERSRDAIQWAPLTDIPGAGTHFGMLDYRQSDPKPFLGQSYYRLKQVNRDGSFSYSPLRAVTVEGDEIPLLLFPNPARMEVNLLLQADLFHVRILDASGREVLSATNTPSIDISALVPGRYTVEVRTLEDRYVLPLMVN